MKKAAIVSVVLVVLASAGGAGGLYAYDSSRDGAIAEGVTIAGIDVGGMQASRARGVVERRIADPIEQPAVVVRGRRSFTLSPERAEIRVDVRRMIGEALAASRDGNFFTRAWRDLTGGSVDRNVPLHASYSRSSVRRFVRRVDRAVSRSPRDASISYTLTRIREVPARDGVRVRTKRLHRLLAARLLRPDASRSLRIPLETVRPEVETAALEREYSHFITISRTTKTLRLFVDFKLAKTYRIAVGQVGYETPGGLYHVQNKAINPAWHVPDSPWAGDLAGKVIPGGAPNNPIVARWMGFFDGAGIHGTNDPGSIGQAASHGCIRMRVPDVIDLYPRVPVGTPLYIV